MAGLILVALSVGPSRPAIAESSPATELPYQLETFVAEDGNVDRGPGAGINHSDEIYGLHVSRDWSTLATPHLRLTTTADGGAQIFEHFDKLDDVSATVTTHLDYRTSGGFTAPLYGCFLRVEGDQSRSDLRSKLGYLLGVQVSDAFTDRISGLASITREQRHAQNDVFSGSDWSANGHLEYSVFAADVLYLNGNYRRGDATLSGLASFENPRTAGGFVDEPDDAFTAYGIRVYRLHAGTAVGAVGVNHAFGANASIDLSWLGAQSRPTALTPFLSTIPTSYIDRQWTLNFVLRL